VTEPVINIALLELRKENFVPNVLGTVLSKSKSLLISKGITMIFVKIKIMTANLINKNK
jgi:hypothetical protein